MSFICDRCKRSFNNCVPIISTNTDNENISLICSGCAQYFGKCYMCKNRDKCDFYDSTDPTPKTFIETKRIKTPIGEQIIQMERPNPERQKIFCTEEKCKCVCEIDGQRYCCKLDQILTCKNYEE